MKPSGEHSSLRLTSTLSDVEFFVQHLPNGNFVVAIGAEAVVITPQQAGLLCSWLETEAGAGTLTVEGRDED